MKIGIGYDIHPIVSGRALILGGVIIPFEKGFDGWSDADVLTHSIIDALLGAAVMGDIGKIFPSNKIEYKNISSLIMLNKVINDIRDKGLEISNIDSTIIAEKPRLTEFIDEMRKKLSNNLNISIEQISIKATTSKGLGVIGKEEGIAAISIALLNKKE